MWMNVLLMVVALAVQPLWAEEGPPQYLYKVVSCDHWKLSQGMAQVKLDNSDSGFIHLSKESQLESILAKYWTGSSSVILKLDTGKLPGRLVYEINPGGENKYYHLYDGAIPLNAIVEVRNRNCK